MIGTIEAVATSDHDRSPFDRWEIYELVHLEDELLDTYGHDYSHGGSPNLSRWVNETLGEIAGLLDACGIPWVDGYGRSLGISLGISPRDMMGDDRVNIERVREALEAFVTAVGRADG